MKKLMCIASVLLFISCAKEEVKDESIEIQSVEGETINFDDC